MTNTLNNNVKSEISPLQRLGNMTSPYCTTKDVAELLGVTIRTVQMWVEAGVLEAWRTSGGHRRIVVASLRQFLEGKARPVPPTQAGLNVLLVEDDEQLQQFFQLRLLSSGTPMKLRLANNGFQALISLGQQMPDVLITDLMMPEMDGFTMLRHLASMADTAHMKIFVVTSLDAQEIEERGGLPPFVQVYAKPIPFDLIESDLKKMYALSLAKHER